MKTYIIVDSSAFQGMIHMLWQSIELYVLHELHPAHVVYTSAQASTRQQTHRLIGEGAKKLIFLGTNQSMQQSMQSIMGYLPHSRSKLKIGFWPVSYADIPFLCWNHSPALKEIMTLFQSNNVCPVAVGQVELVDVAEKKQIRYFWHHCNISGISPRWVTSRKDQEPWVSQSSHLQIHLHRKIPSSLTISPEELCERNVLRLSLVRSPSYFLRKIRNRLFKEHPFTLYDLERYAPCQSISIQSPSRPFSVVLDGVTMQCLSLQCEVVPQAFPLITAAIPRHLKGFSKQQLFNLEGEQGIASTEVVQSHPFNHKDS